MTTARCPICSKPTEAKFAPFCSKRCADVDLSRWLKGAYAIPGRPAEDEGGEETNPQKTSEKQPSDDAD